MNSQSQDSNASNRRGWLRRLSILGLAGFAGMILSACSKSEALTPAGTARPKMLRIGWSPSEEEPERRVRYHGLAEYLAQRLDMPVELIETGTYSTQIESFRARKIEVGSISPFSYVVARQKVPIEPLVVRGYTNGQQGRYNSVLIVPPDSPIRSIEDLKPRAPQLTLAFVDPASTSGHLIPRAFLESAGLNPETSFKNVIFTMSHLATAMTIKSGKVDVAATMNTGLNRLIERGRVTRNDFRIIWESEPIINDVTAVRSDLSPEFREELRQAYLNFPLERPEIWQEFARLFPEPGGIWVVAQDSDFDGLRTIARNVKHIELLQ